MLTSLTKSTYEAILISELRPAMGCTEPIAIAYASSILAKALGTIPTEIEANFSGNIIKNVKSVIVPNTDHMKGIPAAAVAALAIPRCNIVFIEGDEMVSYLNAFYTVLFNANPQSVGGTMPNESLYYKR